MSTSYLWQASAKRRVSLVPDSPRSDVKRDSKWHHTYPCVFLATCRQAQDIASARCEKRSSPGRRVRATQAPLSPRRGCGEDFLRKRDSSSPRRYVTRRTPARHGRKSCLELLCRLATHARCAWSASSR